MRACSCGRVNVMFPAGSGNVTIGAGVACTGVGVVRIGVGVATAVTGGGCWEGLGVQLGVGTRLAEWHWNTIIIHYNYTVR